MTPEERRAKNCERMKARYWADPEYRKKRNAYNKARLEDPEKLARKRMLSKARYWADPKYRAEKQAREKARYLDERVRNPELCDAREHARRLKTKYALTPEAHEELWKTQGCACALCGKGLPLRARNTHVDHCHATGRVRGILCSRCNLRLGVLEDRGEAGVAADFAYVRRAS